MSNLNILLPALLISSLAACAGVDDMNGPNGDRADELGADAGVEEEVEEEVDDGFNAAREVNEAHVTFDDETLAPEFYSVPDHDSDMNLGGTEFWQRWPGGESPTFSYSVGTDFGRRCMYASAVRFSTIMADPPQEILDLQEKTNWGGSFFNWNDDYSGGDRTATAPRLWAWRTHLIKWISQTDGDGSCHLPTLDMLVAAAEDCLETAEANEGEIQGCSAR